MPLSFRKIWSRPVGQCLRCAALVAPGVLLGLLLVLMLGAAPAMALTHADHAYLTAAASDLELARGRGDRAAATAALLRMAAHYRARGLWTQVADLSERARAELPEVDVSPQLLAEVDLSFAAAAQQINRIDEALQPLIRTLATARRLGNAELEARTLVGLSSFQGRGGNYLAAKSLAESGLEAARQAGNREWEARALLNLAKISGHEGQSEQAIAYVQQAMQVAPVEDDSDLPQQLLLAAAVTAQGLGASPEVLKTARLAVSQARAASNSYLLAYALVTQGQLQCSLDDSSAGLASFEEAGTLFVPENYPYDAGRTQQAWSDCLAGIGRYQEAYEHARMGRKLTELGFDRRRIESVEALDYAYRDQLRLRQVADVAAAQQSLSAQLQQQRALVVIVGLALLVALVAVLWLLSRARAARAQSLAADAAQQARADLLAMAGHEIRNPSQGLLSSLAALRDLPLNPQQRQAMDTATHAADMIARLSRDVFNLALSEQDRLVVHRRFVQTDSLVRDAVALIAPAAAAKGIVLQINQQADGRRVDVDAERIMQALVNLLTNAVRYTESGQITVDSELVDGEHPLWRCDISDTGPGIAESELAHVFDPYFRGEQGVRSHGGGLGLAVVQRVIAVHGGTIRVENRSSGGARFRIELPVRVLEAETHPASEKVNEQPLARTRILLVDDDEDVRIGVAAMAEHAGAQVSLAADGAEAAAQFRRVLPDAVLVDLHLGQERGDAVAAMLRTLAPTLACRWILATGSMSCDTTIEGFDAVLIKPYTMTELIDALQITTDRITA